MLSCEKATDKLSAQLDGELSLRERAALRFHQFICSDCKSAAQNFRSLVNSMRDRPPVGLDPSASNTQSAAGTPVQTSASEEAYVDRIMQALEDEAARD